MIIHRIKRKNKPINKSTNILLVNSSANPVPHTTIRGHKKWGVSGDVSILLKKPEILVHARLSIRYFVLL